MIRRNRTTRQKRSYSSTAPPVKRRRTSRGLVPQYAGFNPRAFSRGEWKYIDSNANALVNDTAQLILLNGLSPGTGASQRIGMKVMMRSLELRIRVTPQSTTTSIEQIGRFVIVLDRQPNGAAPSAVTDILTVASVISPRNLAQRKRFKILWDKILTLGTVSGGSAISSQALGNRVVKLYMKLRRPVVEEFNSGVAGTIADIATNSLYLMYFGTADHNLSTAHMAYYHARLRYTDM